MAWQAIRGHEALIRSLREVARTGRLGHAYLFVGPSGVGKRRVALELAKALLCESPPEPIAACDKCPACSQVMAETHPDLIRAARPEEKNEFIVEVIEAVIESLALKPARGKYKIAIIDDADDFNASSANKFLKTLEEPPPRTLLILLATDLERQLPTIRSRCQVVRFAPLPVAVIADLLRETGVEAERAEPLARLGGGSIGRALDLADES